jgi:hypothetical protein
MLADRSPSGLVHVSPPCAAPAPRVSRWATWCAQEYYEHYYAGSVLRDDREVLRHHIAYLAAAGRTFPAALEYGCGPTLLRAIAAARYVECLDMADRLDDNLACVSRWVNKEKQAHDWTPFTAEVLRSEGVAHPDAATVAAREELTRRVVGRLFITDARDRHPLSKYRVGSYDLVITGYCLDCLSASKRVWARCMRNVLSLLRPGGSLVLCALNRSRAFRTGGTWFPAANIGRDDLFATLRTNGFDAGSIAIERHDFPEHRASGYEAILLATASKAGGR